MRGLRNNINASLYSNPEFTCEQMEEIRLGLENGIDVTSYLNPSINKKEMKKIRRNLEKKQ